VKRLRLLVFAILLGGLLAIPAPAVGANAYLFYVACSHSKSAPPATSCPKNSKKAAFFKSNNAHVQYKICVKFPNGTNICASAQDAPQGEKRVNTITSSVKGQHRVRWFVAGKRVGQKFFNVT
jgi:hypothetical protein